MNTVLINSPYWDTYSVICYIIFALVGLICLKLSKRNYTGYKNTFFSRNRFYLIWLLIWTIAATGRLVTYSVGGTDAPVYIEYFNICKDQRIPIYYEHYDILYKYINIAIRSVTSDYHIFFFIIYGFMTFSIIYFVKEFCPVKTNFIPYILTFFLFLRGFLTIRSNLAICVLMLALVFLYRGKLKTAILIGVSSIFIHKAAVLYFLCIPIYLLLKRKNIKIRVVLLSICVAYVFGILLRSYFILFASFNDLGGAYGDYASGAVGSSFFDNAWKIAFEQLLFGLILFLNWKSLKKYIATDVNYGKKIKFVLFVCCYDLALVPINYLFSIWRGYEFFYIERIVIWGQLLYLLNKKVPHKFVFVSNVAYLSLFVWWFIFRLQHTYEDSNLLPYYFEPLLLLN